MAQTGTEKKKIPSTLSLWHRNVGILEFLLVLFSVVLITSSSLGSFSLWYLMVVVRIVLDMSLFVLVFDVHNTLGKELRSIWPTAFVSIHSKPRGNHLRHYNFYGTLVPRVRIP
jgi:hypothetical protein